MKRMLAGLILMALPLAAQPAPDKKPNQRLIVLKYADPQAIAQLLRVFNTQIIPNSELHTIAIDARPADWPSIEEIIQRLDVPSAAPKNVELTMYFLLGSADEPTAGSAIAPDLEPVMAQLTRAFAYKYYRMLDALVIRTRVGTTAEASGSVAPLRTRASEGRPAQPPAVTQVKLRAAALDAEGTIHIDRLNAGVRSPSSVDSKGSTMYIETGVNTDIDIKDGQKVVVGKSSYGGPDRALFLILSAKVL